jgi:hypothetical protein
MPQRRRGDAAPWPAHGGGGRRAQPWGEAAKGILHVKGIAWAAVRLDYTSDALKQWAGGRRDGPIAFFDDEPPRAGWDQILLLAGRLAPEPTLLPTDPAERALAFGLAHELCAEGGLGWARRLQLVHAGQQGAGGFAGRVAGYLGKKSGYRPEDAPPTVRVAALLGMLARACSPTGQAAATTSATR